LNKKQTVPCLKNILGVYIFASCTEYLVVVLIAVDLSFPMAFE